MKLKTRLEYTRTPAIMPNMKLIQITALMLILSVFSPKSAAYIDLGTGSYIIQIVLAGLFSTLFVFRSSIKKVFFLVKSLLNPQKDEKQE